MMTFEETKKYIRSQNIKWTGKNDEELQAEYHIWWDKNKEENLRVGLPRNPDEVYKK